MSSYETISDKLGAMQGPLRAVSFLDRAGKNICRRFYGWEERDKHEF